MSSLLEQVSPTLSFLSAQPLWLQAVVGLAALVALALLLHVVTRRLVLTGVRMMVERTSVAWDGVLFQSHVPHRLARLVPLVALQAGLPFVPGLPAPLLGLLQRVVAATIIVVVARILDAFLTATHELYSRVPTAATRPIKSWVQLAKLFVYLVAGVFVVARLADQSPWFFVSGLGAMMAIILLIFRDTLLSLVASVQLTNNDLVRVGDWIEMPQFDADGDVIDIALNTVRVRNWDRTVTVIPTHKFLEHSFRNWRGMFEGGGRRIKRAIHVNTSSIRFLTEEEIERFGRFALLKDYIAAKVDELREHNARWGDDPETIVDSRRLTNVGTLRAYITAYLRNHPKIHQEMTFLVRQLAPTPEGLPLEIYVFTNDTRWAFYEGIQADVFDHILAMVPEFGLSVYQRPSGYDFRGSALKEGAPAT
ncbi:MAG TPA: mechanosensitive ion channel domain-containing protein [Gemmatimonadales bacterium]